MQNAIIVLLIVFATAAALSPVEIKIAFAEDNPCSEGQIPRLDSNGDPVRDPDTHKPVCVDGP